MDLLKTAFLNEFKPTQTVDITVLTITILRMSIFQVLLTEAI